MQGWISQANFLIISNEYEKIKSSLKATQPIEKVAEEPKVIVAEKKEIKKPFIKLEKKKD
jgi:hypothetical protein